MCDAPFAEAFRALTGNTPFPWQSRLYERFCDEDFPEACILEETRGGVVV